MSLRVRLLGTIAVVVVLFFVMSIFAARFSLQHDLTDLGRTEVTNGSNGFAGYWDSKKNEVRLLITQDADADVLQKSLQAHNASGLRDELSAIARASGLSFLTVVDTSGNVIARASGSTRGTLSSNAYVRRALSGETVSTAAIMQPGELRAEGLISQAEADVQNDGKITEHIDTGLALIAAVPMSDASGRTFGAVYGGIVMNHYYDLVDESTRSLGGQTAILYRDAIVSSTLSEPDGTRVVDTQVGRGDRRLNPKSPYVAVDTEGGTRYLSRVDPITDDQDAVVGSRWYGIPLSQISSIQDHMTETFMLWALVAMIVALLIAVPIVQRLSADIAKRSGQVSAAAKDLGIAIVGSEVSGDHVAATKAAVERSGKIINDIAAGRTGADLHDLKTVNDELHGDIIVIDTLSQEMSDRLQRAVARVAELNEVANGLDQLVHGVAAK